jgi:hypothetical protein
VSLDDRDWYREAIREKAERLNNPPPPPADTLPPHLWQIPELPPQRPRTRKRELTWAVIIPIAIGAGKLSFWLVFAVCEYFGSR